MTVEQQLACFKHHDRRKAEQLKKFGGITPKRPERRPIGWPSSNVSSSAADKAIADARDQASAEATATTEARVRAEMAGQLLEATVAGSGLPEAQQKAVLAMTDAPVPRRVRHVRHRRPARASGDLRQHHAVGTSRQWVKAATTSHRPTRVRRWVWPRHKRFGKNS